MQRRNFLTALGLAGISTVAGATVAHATGNEPTVNESTEGKNFKAVWQRQSLPYGVTPRKIVAHASGRWLVGGRADFDGTPYPYAARWDGSTWVETPTPQVAQATLYCLVVVSAKEVWAAGAAALDSYETKHFVLRWNGSRWQRVTGPTQFGQFGAAAVGPDGIYFGGWSRLGTDEPGVVYRRTASGWKLIGSPVEGSINVNALLVRSKSTILAPGNPAFTRFNGTSWQPVPGFAGDGSTILSGIAMRGGTNWVVGVRHNGGPDGEQPIAFRGSGQNWSPIPVSVTSGQFSEVAVGDFGAIAVGDRFINSPDQSISTRPLIAAFDGKRFVAATKVADLTEASITTVSIRPKSTETWAAGIDLTDWSGFVLRRRLVKA